MQVIIIGSGIIGTLTSYLLLKKGFKVKLIDQKSISETIKFQGNSGNMAFSSIAPGEYPFFGLHFYSKLQHLLPINLNTKIWNILHNKFISSWLNKKNKYALEIIRGYLFNLGQYSRTIFQSIAEEVGFEYQKQGILHLYFNESRFNTIKESIKLKNKMFNLETEIINHNEALLLEPSLQNIKSKITGAIYYPNDFTANSSEFLKSILNKSLELGLELIENCTVEKLITENSKVKSIITNDNIEIGGGKFIIATGALGENILKPLGINFNLYPIKGYAIDIETDILPIRGIGDMGNRIYYSNFGNKLRVAGTQEAIGFKPGVDENRMEIIFSSVKKLFPEINVVSKDLNNKIKRYYCYRPVSQNGWPYIGKADGYSNLYLNIGHGGLGWTLSAASAKIIADSIEY